MTPTLQHPKYCLNTQYFKSEGTGIFIKGKDKESDFPFKNIFFSISLHGFELKF